MDRFWSNFFLYIFGSCTVQSLSASNWVPDSPTVPNFEKNASKFTCKREKNVQITEQNDRRFKGHFTYSDGTKNFYGIIHPDNITITWVASNSRGYNIGKILEKNKISACYVESGIDATVGCAVLSRTKK